MTVFFIRVLFVTMKNQASVCNKTDQIETY